MIPQSPLAPVIRTLPESLVPERNGVTVWWSTIKILGQVGPGWKDKLLAGWQSLNT